VFWRQTPRTFAAWLDGRNQALEQRQREQGWTAWHMALLTHCDPKKFPRLEEMLPGSRPKRPQTADEMIAAMDMVMTLQGSGTDAGAGEG
jgi:hypothetical protein